MASESQTGLALCHGNVALDTVLHFGPDSKLMEASSSSDSESVSRTFDLNSMSPSQSPQPENAEDVTIPTLSTRSDFKLNFSKLIYI